MSNVWGRRVTGVPTATKSYTSILVIGGSPCHRSSTLTPSGHTFDPPSAGGFSPSKLDLFHLPFQVA